MARAALLCGVFLSSFFAVVAWPAERPKLGVAAALLAALLAAIASRTAPAEDDAPPAARAARVYVVLATAAFALYAWVFVAASTVTIGGRTYYALFDDAMISMRYGWNLAHGLGLVWNPGERVEGFSNPLMVLLMAGATAVFDKAHAVLAVHVLGAALALAGAHMNRRLAGHVFAAERPALREILAAVAFTAPLLYYPFAYWAILGMETSLVAVLAAAAVLLSTRRADDTRPRYALVLLLAAMAWTRPDAALQAAIILAFRAHRLRRAALRALAVEAALFGGLVAANYLARRAYYGTWLPNTYVLKVTGLPLGERLADGVAFSAAFLRDTWPAVALALAGLVLRPHPLKLLGLVLLGSTVAYQTWVGGDAWPYWRIMTPYVPLLFLCALDGALALSARLSAVPALPIAIAAAVLGLADRPFAEELLCTVPPSGTRSTLRELRIAAELSRIASPEATVGVFLAGMVPYYTGARAIDFLGKSDPYIARLPARPFHDREGHKSAPGHNKYDLAYSIVKLQPDYVAGFRWGLDDVRWFARERYVRSGDLWLLRGSPRIRWDLVDLARPDPE